MEPEYRLSRHDPEKSEAPRERLDAEAVVRNESLRDHVRQSSMRYEPMPPEPIYNRYSLTRSRSTSSSGTSSHHLLQPELLSVAAPPQLSWVEEPKFILPTDEDYDDDEEVGRNHSLARESLLSPRPLAGSGGGEPAVLKRIYHEILRLETPELPARLETPHTMPVVLHNHSDQGSFSDVDLNRPLPTLPNRIPVPPVNAVMQGALVEPTLPMSSLALPPVPRHTPSSNPMVTGLHIVDRDPRLPPGSHLVTTMATTPGNAVSQGSLFLATRRLEALRSADSQYLPLRPDVGSDAKPFGTFTHVRGGPKFTSAAATGVKRKPLSPDAQPIEYNHSLKTELCMVMVVCMARLLVVAALAQTLVPARQISQSFDRSQRTTGHLAWYSAAYALGVGIFSLVANRVGQVYGHKTAFVGGYLWLGLWSLLAGVSVFVKNDGMAYFCVCRFLQGAGAAFMSNNGQTILQRAYPPGRRKDVVLGLLKACAPLGFVMGAVMASLCSEFSCWSAAFFSLASISLSLTVLGMLTLPSKDVQQNDLDGGIWARLDAVGFAAAMSALLLFAVGWNQVSALSFNAPVGPVLFNIGALMMIPFVYVELKATHPLVPFRKMHATSSITLLYVFAVSGAFIIWAWYIIRIIQDLRQWNALLTSAAFVPLLVSGVLVGAWGHKVLYNLHATQWSLAGGSLVVLTSSILMATSPTGQSFWLNTYFSILMMPIGVCLSLPASTLLLEEKVPQGQSGLASSLATAVAWYAMSLCLGLAGALEVSGRSMGVLASFRAGQYFGVGLSSLGVMLTIVVLLASRFRVYKRLV